MHSPLTESDIGGILDGAVFVVGMLFLAVLMFADRRKR